MDQRLTSFFFEQVSVTLAFVATERGFSGPSYEVDAQAGFAYAVFTGKHLAIEFSLDGREHDVTCIIARVTAGQRATYRDAVDEFDRNGIRVREYLTRWLLRRGVRQLPLTRTGGGDVYERIRIRLGDFAQILKTLGEDILTDSQSVLSTA